MDTPPRPPHATPPGQPARAHNVRGRPPVPSGSPAGGGPCGDPDVGAACGALGRARPRLVPLGSQCSVGGREPRPESCGGAAGQPAVPMRVAESGGRARMCQDRAWPPSSPGGHRGPGGRRQQVEKPWSSQRRAAGGGQWPCCQGGRMPGAGGVAWTPGALTGLRPGGGAAASCSS